MPTTAFALRRVDRLEAEACRLDDRLSVSEVSDSTQSTDSALEPADD